MNKLRFLWVALAVVSACTAASASTFFDDFEAYAAGSNLHGQAGWKGWDNAAGATGVVSDKYAFSGKNSLEIIGSSDQVYEFKLAGGRYVLTAMQYIPSGTTGTSYFILMSKYQDGGASNEWAVQTEYRTDTKVINTWHGGLAPVDIILDEWVQVKLVIDLVKNTVQEYYGGELIATDTWSASNSGTFAAIDLYGNGAGSVFYDDVKIEAYQVFQATEPNPSDGATGVGTPLLRWTVGDTAMFHDVYLGTTAELTTDNQVGTHQPFAMYYHVQGFQPGVTYYWRVDEIEANGTMHAGDVWSFTAAPLTAYQANPWDGAKGIDPQAAELSWSAGSGADSHDVYFGSSRDDVANGTGDTFKGNQLAVAYAPGALAANTTYYWRVDEVDAAGTKTVGPVWSFTSRGPRDGVKAEYFLGMGLGGEPVLTQVEPVIDHSWGEDEVAAKLVDNVSARWTAVLEVPFTETYTLITTSDDGVRLWLDGRRVIDNWTDHGSTVNRAKVDLVSGQPYLLVMEWYENGGSAIAQLSWESPSIPRQTIPAGVLQLPLVAATPSPQQGATDVSQTTQLRWVAGEKAAQHEVYFSEDRDAVANRTAPVARLAGDQTVFDPGLLQWNKTYFWRVDEVNDADADSPWQGNVFSFTTADFLVVDDFEAYTDNMEAEEAVFQTWIDGLTNQTGSVAGYGQSAGGTFNELSIVHDGRQAMPLDYNNVNAPYYSEVERTWSAAQDWTANGADTLVLYVRGKGGNNASQPLYVGLEDKGGNSGVVTAPDTAILKSSTWIEWRIPLSAFGVNAAAISKMTIGIGDKSKPTAGGAGRIFIDGIRVLGSAGQ
jgi:hypothetical protein